MAFDYDTSEPTNTRVVSTYPANARAFRVAVEGSALVEHDATASGRHKFGIGTTAARDAITTWVVGGVWFNTDRHTSRTLVDVCDGVGPVTWDETDIIFVDEANTWTKAQRATYLAMGTTGSGPQVLDWDPTDRNSFKHTLTEDSQMANPVPALASDEFTSWVFEITQNGTGSHALTFASNRVPDGGGQVDIASGANKITYIRAHTSTDQKVIYQVSPR